LHVEPVHPRQVQIENDIHLPDCVLFIGNLALFFSPKPRNCSLEHYQAIMPKPLNVDWPAVRVLAVAVGVREAARQMGISEDAVRQRSKREGWMTSPKAVAQRALAKPVTSVSPNALSPADALVNVLQEHERETKLSLARSARRMAKDAEQATLREASYVHKAAQVASITHRWGEREKNPNAILNLAILTGVEVPERVIDARECQDSGD
jgi:hypothetical protein